MRGKNLLNVSVQVKPAATAPARIQSVSNVVATINTLKHGSPTVTVGLQ